MRSVKRVLALGSLVFSQQVSAADLCRATVLRPVRAVEDSSSIAKPGEVLTAVTQYVRNKKTGVTSICSHGGYCYPTQVLVGGHKLPALKVTNCNVDPRRPYVDSDEVIYGFVVDRSKNSAADLRFDDLENKLLGLGLCNACASNVATFYLKKPSSRCATLARAALRGSRRALDALQQDPPYCSWNG